jgi:hypothetical protein
MPRRRLKAPRDADVLPLDLAVGPFRSVWRDVPDEDRDDAFRLAWARRRDGMLEHFRRERPGDRPWAFWRYELSEPVRHGEDAVRRLLELDQMDADERAAVIAAGHRVVAEHVVGAPAWTTVPDAVRRAEGCPGPPGRRSDGRPDLGHSTLSSAST